ncbi:thiolase family protein [Thermomonas carbonis]|uniref:Acetyl-CoA C-acyltransferase n=1 Tax=Thermomonas carbonis TaxID=1463158 RepID=A0A7G9SPP2_9GAMM|nr:acetyl-CoA C-acyltransferase [Thermomonas carbonis]QNN69817.1 acetyl-CoA C-acyltransferase [Thermomonas carbonis]GHB95722.1 acetyl-CoA acetyltransferase [Thermomonas carbonis]
MSDVVIVGAKRTAIGSFLGQFTGVPSPTLGTAAIQGALAQAGVNADQIDEVIMGCVLPAGLGQAPARQASRAAGIPDAAGCTTINKVCGSGMKAVMLAHDIIKAGSAKAVVAGGMESMTNAPHLLNGSRTGIRFGNGELLDHMAWDGLTNPDDGKAMGVFGDAACAKYGYDRAAVDAFAAESVKRAQAAQASGAFAGEITAVTVKTRKGELVVDKDEEPGKIDPSKIPDLRAAFGKDGVLTAASSSKISDGAAALVVMSADAAAAAGATPLARIVAHATHAQAPEWFTTAPVTALQNVLAKAGWSVADVDLFEVNEAFACVAMAPMTDLGIAHEKLNVNGGALALGHPIGASGARLLVTLLNALQARGGKRGVASLCIGGGEAVALAIELV